MMRALLERFEFEEPWAIDRGQPPCLAVACPPADDGQLASLADGSLAAHFRYWRGASGRRYVFSVYDKVSCPAYDHAVLIAVTKEASGRRRIAFIADTGSLPELVLAEAIRVAGEGAVELHTHLLAASTVERAEVVADLTDAA
jgi:hypothetical protein